MVGAEAKELPGPRPLREVTTAESPNSVTIKEVAREAGVSVATVSRTFNKSGPVKDETRIRVEAAAERLHYTPNVAARSLITRRTHTIGVLLPHLYGEFFSEVIRGADQAARERRHHLLVSGSHNDHGEVRAAVRAMHGRIDGLIIMSPELEARTLIDDLPRRVPTVLLNCDVGGETFDAVDVDNFGGARAMVRHLRNLGHRRIAIINGDVENNFDARERLRGYRAAMGEDGVASPDELEIDGDFTWAAGYRAGREFLDLEPRPTAVFAANDSMAIAALSAFREAGVAVPEDVAVAGFDDIPIARYASPPLTSVHVPIRGLGARAMARLFEAMEGREEGEVRPRGRQETLPTRVVVRDSCGGGRGARPASRTRPQRQRASTRNLRRTEA